MDIPTIVTSVGSSGLLVFLLQQWIKSSIEHKYEAKQIQMKAQLDGELEGVKAGYKRVLDENQIRFSRVYTDQAEAVKRLFSLLSKMERKLKFLTSPLQFVPKDLEEQKVFYQKQRQEAADAHSDCRECFDENLILLPKDVCEEVEKLLATAKSAYIDFTMYDGMECDVAAHGRTQIRLTAWDRMTKDFSSIKGKLQDRFRELLGSVDGSPVTPSQ